MNAPAGSPENTGDGLQMAMNVGAKQGTCECVVGSSSQSAREMQYGMSHLGHTLERTRPHSFMVNREGKRFTNEAGNPTPWVGSCV